MRRTSGAMPRWRPSKPRRRERDAARQVADEQGGHREIAEQGAAAAAAERDRAIEHADAARAERDAVLAETADGRAEHERLIRKLRQHEAQIALLRADASRDPGSNGNVRLRHLESEREQLVTHVQALSELLLADPDRDGGEAGAEIESDRVAALRAEAVQAANEQAERELRRLRAASPE